MNYVFILLSLLLIIVVLVNQKLGLKFFLIAILIYPYLKFGQYVARIDLFLTPVIFLLFLVKSRSLSFKINKVFLFLLTLFIWYVLVTASQLLLYENYTEVQLVSFYSLLMLLLVTFIFSNIDFSEKDMLELIIIFGILAIPISLFTIGQFIGNKFITSITINSYISLSREVPAKILLGTYGRLIRAIGVFETPVYAASYFLLVMINNFIILSDLFHRIGRALRLLLIFSTILSIIGGILTLSSTFLAGIVVMILIFIILDSRKKTKLISIGILLLFVALLNIFMKISPQLQSPLFGVLSYQINRIIDFSLFNTRYGDSGLLNSTIKAITERPVTGWGLVSQEGIFIGDSQYVTLLYNGGVIALVLFLGFIKMVISTSQKDKYYGKLILFWTLILMATGVGSPSFFIPRLQTWYWVITAISLNVMERRKLEYALQDSSNNT
jgi:hypothetical protein